MVRTNLIGRVPGPPERDAPVPPFSPLAEHAMVTLSAPFVLDDGRHLPCGARGAVVFVHGDGDAYMVEVVTPFHAVITVTASDLSGETAV